MGPFALTGNHGGSYAHPAVDSGSFPGDVTPTWVSLGMGRGVKEQREKNEKEKRKRQKEKEREKKKEKSPEAHC